MKLLQQLEVQRGLQKHTDNDRFVGEGEEGEEGRGGKNKSTRKTNEKGR